MSTRYYELTESERIALSPEATLEAVKIEAISRGIRPPVTLTDELKSAGFAGFQIPANALRVYEVMTKSEPHGSPHETGLCYPTEQEAVAAIQGALCLSDQYINNSGGYRTVKRLSAGNCSVQLRFIGEDVKFSYQKKLEQSDAESISPEFEKLADECRDDQARIRQAAYDKQVRTRKRAEYLLLARGDEAIASAFWRKVESGEFPSE